MSKPKLILINGFAGSGKTTIAKRYIAQHPLALMIEGDELIVNMGDWLPNETKARQLVYQLQLAMVGTHLNNGYDVVLPYLVVDNNHVQAFLSVAQQANANFYGVLLHHPRQTAINKLLARGTWGEAGMDPLNDTDLPVIEGLYDRMEAELEDQKYDLVIDQQDKTIDQTFAALLDIINRSESGL